MSTPCSELNYIGLKITLTKNSSKMEMCATNHSITPDVEDNLI